jgi:hypothetical protein
MFFRTSDGCEADLLLKYGDDLWAIEIKLGSSPSQADFKGLNKAADLAGAQKRVLVSNVQETTASDKFISTNLPGLVERLRTSFASQAK